MANLLMFLVLVGFTISEASRTSHPFAMCEVYFRRENGKCYLGNECPKGTEQKKKRYQFWNTCAESGYSCCTGTPEATDDCQNDDQCGRWSPAARLAFSQTQAPRQSPWQASIRRITVPGAGYTLQNSFHLAGGVLINKRWVLTDVLGALTAGRQWANETWQENAVVVLGDYNVMYPEVYNNAAQEQVRRIKSITFHPAFKYDNFTSVAEIFETSIPNNPEYHQSFAFCLIELEQPVVYNDWVRPVCLPSVEPTCSNYKECRVTGWGLDETENLNEVIRVAKVNDFSKEACEAIEYFGSGRTVVLPTGTKCAINNSTLSYVGDFGGPLVCNDVSNSNRATLGGIMTFDLFYRQGNSVLLSDVNSVIADWIWTTCRSKLD